MAVGRTAVGRGRGYVSDRVRVFGQDRVSRIFRGESGCEESGVSDAAWRVRKGRRAESGGHVVGARRVLLSHRQGLSAGTGAIHAAVSLVLPGASRGCVRLPDE